MGNPDFANVFKEMETAIIQLISEAGIITEDAAKLMQMQSEQIQNQYANLQAHLSQPNSSGAFPGSNPLDLL